MYGQFDDGTDLVRTLPFELNFPDFTSGEGEEWDLILQLTISPLFREGFIGIKQEAILISDDNPQENISNG